jgi:hypothetical protein
MFDAIGGIFNMGMGISQMVQGQAGLSQLQRPEYNTPREIEEMQALSRMEYQDPLMPGELAARDRLAQSSAKAYQQASAAGNPFAAIAAIQAGQQAGDLNLSTQSAMHRAKDLEAYKRALQTTAKYRDMEFQMNEFAPYAEKAQEYRDMIGAGTKNVKSGISEFGGVADAWMTAGFENSTGGYDSTPADTSDVYSQWNQSSSASNQWDQYGGDIDASNYSGYYG